VADSPLVIPAVLASIEVGELAVVPVPLLHELALLDFKLELIVVVFFRFLSRGLEDCSGLGWSLFFEMAESCSVVGGHISIKAMLVTASFPLITERRRIEGQRSIVFAQDLTIRLTPEVILLFRFVSSIG